MLPIKPNFTTKGQFRGLTLLETMLALTIGAMVFTTSIYGLNRYQDNVKIQSSAGMLSRLSKAADLYGNEHYRELLANAPQILPISVLEPYFGTNIGSDAFATKYSIATRAFTYNATDAASNPRTRNAIQLLIVGEHNKNGSVEHNSSIRVDIANIANATAGFISTSTTTCKNAAGTADRAPGDICGAFGAYSASNSDFPMINLQNAAYVALVTKGDASVYGGQMYRYDLGDQELNKMDVDVNMNNYDILKPAHISGVDQITFDADTPSEQLITTNSDQLTLKSADTTPIRLDPGTGRVEINQTTNPPILAGSADTLTIGETGDSLIFGQLANDTIKLNGADDTKQIGGSDLTVGSLSAKNAFAHEVNSLHESEYDPLRLQNFENGEVVVGKRVAYTPGGTARYDISDGRVTAQHVSVQDIECADCGGALSNILPRWRHMGTYFIEDAATPSSGTWVPKPNCQNVRRSPSNVASNGEDPATAETSDDPRYEPRIIVVPKKFGMTEQWIGSVQAVNARMVFAFDAVDADASRWKVYPRVYNGIIESLTLEAASIMKTQTASNPIKTKDVTICNKYTEEPNVNAIDIMTSDINVKPALCAHIPFFPERLEKYAIATGLAMTYCKYTGGENIDPSEKLNYAYPTTTDTSRGFDVIE